MNKETKIKFYIFYIFVNGFMDFKSKGELLLKLRSFKNIGEGSQGVCYLDKNSGIVYKIFNRLVRKLKI